MPLPRPALLPLPVPVPMPGLLPTPARVVGCGYEVVKRSQTLPDSC